ncbi:MAG: S-methyl-5-thioribose-1-phosphate isomerase [Candidatus Eremiobacteraeota bacterium]|nr:S-methyl-5-thioribose-1-phosphate isomerase [Candidatus Eremiobacteraeota bacterium]
MAENIVPVWWDGDAVGYIDQRLLPHVRVPLRAETVDALVDAIATLAVRGAPAIGVFGAYGVALARRLHADDTTFAASVERIRAARPTAVNLAWAIDRVRSAEPEAMLDVALAIHEEQRAVDRAIAQHGAALMPAEGAVLTHCDTGPLATGGEGTALAVIVEACRRGKRLRPILDETRPLLQGARLSTFEFAAAGIHATLIADGAAAAAIGALGVRCCVVGADRIAANGDTANKIGTFGLAIAAAYHRIPFYVAAPRSTIDFSLHSGELIPIEQRSADEVLSFAGTQVAPEGTAAYNPAFDVTPARLITAIITEFGVCKPPYTDSVPDLKTRAQGLFVTAARR